MPVVLKPDVPQPAYPPPERLIFDATPLQARGEALLQLPPLSFVAATLRLD